MDKCYKKELDAMTWSFSRIKLYNQCPYAFYLRYIECAEESDDDFYSSNGSLMHEIFEKLINNEFSLQEAVDYYIEEVEYLRYMISPSIFKSTFQSCVDYLCECEPFSRDKYDIYAENKIEFTLEGYRFICFIDVCLVEKTTGEIIILDHKSSTSQIFKKNGGVLKGKEQILDAYKKQLYTYAYAVYVIRRRYPSKLIIHHFKDNGALTIFDFNIDELNNTLRWLLDSIQNIYQDVNFNENKEWFFCNNLCSYRSDCCYLKEESE